MQGINVKPMKQKGVRTRGDSGGVGIPAGCPASAQKAADDAIAYMNNLNRLHTGRLDGANFITHLRYDLFNRFGIIPPKEWESLNPDVETLTDATSVQPLFKHVETPEIHAY